MRKQKGTTMMTPRRKQQSMRLTLSALLLALVSVMRKQRGRAESVKQPTNSSMIEMAVFCSKMEILTLANRQLMNLQTVTVSTTECRNSMMDSAFISRKSVFRFISVTFGLFVLVDVPRVRLRSMPMALRTEELKLLNSICRMFQRKKGSSIAGKKQRQMMFQLFINFRKRNSKPQMFITVAKLETTTERN